MLDKKRLMASVFIAAIIVTGAFLWFGRDEFFKSVVEVTYPDGCMEKFINSELVTDKCVEGRALEKGTGRPGLMPITNDNMFIPMSEINWTDNKSIS